jgi:type 1 glutamine amidotransferase
LAGPAAAEPPEQSSDSQEAPAASQETSRAGVRVLIVTGEDYPGHKWQQTTPVLRDQLGQDRRISVDVVEDLKLLRSLDLGRYDSVVMHFKNYDPKVPGPGGWTNLEKFVRDGGGLVLVHFACGAFQEWPGFVKLAGRVWNPDLRAHDPHGTFRVDIINTDHPITSGMESFDTTDELYTCLDGETPIEVLAASTSKVDKKPYPMAFVLRYGQGRVFHCPLGHDATALKIPAVGQLFCRGCAWTAGLKPAPRTPTE